MFIILLLWTLWEMIVENEVLEARTKRLEQFVINNQRKSEFNYEETMYDRVLNDSIKYLNEHK